MQAALRSYAAALRDLACGLRSRSTDPQQLRQLGEAVVAACDLVPAEKLSAFQPEAQAVFSALFDALDALADKRHARTRDWVLLVTTALDAWPCVMHSCQRDGVTTAAGRQAEQWLMQQGPTFLPVLAEVLHQLCAAMAEQPVEAGGQPGRVHAAAAESLFHCLGILVLAAVPYSGKSENAMQPSLSAAAGLAHLLINGCSDLPAVDPAMGISSCSCSLAGAPAADAPLALQRAAAGSLAFQQGGTPMPAGEVIGSILSHVSTLCEHQCQGDVNRVKVASRGGLQLVLQDIALRVAHARQQRAAAAAGNSGASSSGGGGSSVPSCADLGVFVGEADAAAIPLSIAPIPGPAASLQLLVSWATTTLSRLQQMEGCAPTCARCTPEQLCLLVEAATLYPDEALAAVGGSSIGGELQSLAEVQCNALGDLAEILLDQEQAWARFLPAFMQRAVPALSAWAVAAARQLAGASGDPDARRHLAQALLMATCLVLLRPGGVLPAPGNHPGAPIAELAAAAELAMRGAPTPFMPAALLGVDVLKGFVEFTPASFDQLWRSGALPSLVATVCKATGASVDTLVALGSLLGMLLPYPGQAPWYAASSERRQFAVYVLARVGGRAAAIAATFAANPDAAESHSPYEAHHVADVISLVQGASQLLGRPPLRQLVEAAAPALLPEADAVAGSRQGAGTGRQSLQLLFALSRQLDPLALGLDLPGCYNPACTSLAGASEADMPVQRCTGCKMAWYCGPECLKAHWKQHKAGCKRAAAAAAAREADQQQQQQQQQ